jgi:hypothetical protein
MSTWSTKVSRGQFAYMAVYHGTSDLTTVTNKLDLDAIVAIHYRDSTTLYKAIGEESCKISVPTGESFESITGVKYEWPDLRG